MDINKKDFNSKNNFGEPRSRKSGFRHYLTLSIIGICIFVGGWSLGSSNIDISLFDNNIKTQNENLPAELDYSSVDEVYDLIRENYDGELKLDAVMNGLKNGLANSTGDPYTEYLSKEEADEFDDELNGSFSGIGAELSKENDLLVVVSPISGFPADKAGLLPKDVITEIDGENTFDMSLSQAVNKIRGESGSSVELKVLRKGENPKKLKIIRENITIPSVESSMKENNIGYIKISRFDESTADLAKKASENLKSKGAKKIILDLRGNPGGLITSAVDVSSLWLEKGTLVVQEKRGETVIESHDANGTNLLLGFETVILIDEGSASASEIVAGALKDHNKATLIGEDSYGKGSVQQLTPVSSGGLLKITIARWYTPNGRNIDKEGISPDKKVPMTGNDTKSDSDQQLNYAIKYLDNN